MTPAATEKNMKSKLIKLVGKLIATGHSSSRKGRSDFWSGVISDAGKLYSVSVRWPDGSEWHEVYANIRELKTTSRTFWTVEEIENL